MTRTSNAGRKSKSAGSISYNPKARAKRTSSKTAQSPGLRTFAPDGLSTQVSPENPMSRSSPLGANEPVSTSPKNSPGNMDINDMIKYIPRCNKPSNTKVRNSRVFCNQCNQSTSGYKGDHELRRHVNAKHATIATKFVCRDPATVGIVSGLTLKKPLADCKYCAQGKEYNSYCSAAAHLRRMHFNPSFSHPEQRGLCRRDWPPMKDIKPWFEERLVASTHLQIPGSGESQFEVEMPPLPEEKQSESFPEITEYWQLGTYAQGSLTELFSDHYAASYLATPYDGQERQPYA